jgi:ADP-heptose:LPS heptosyltransferase
MIAPASLHPSKWAASVTRGLRALGYVVGTVVPIILRTGKRPVIFNKHSGIGDIICTFPAALELKKRFPGAEVIYNCFEDYSCLPKLGGVTDHVTSFKEIGSVGHWYRFLLSGYFQFHSDDDPVDAIPTEVYIKDFGRHFGVTLDGSHPRLNVPAEALSTAKKILEGQPSGPLIVLHPGPSWPVREWPHDYWVSLAAELRRHGFDNLVQLGVGMTVRFGETEIPAIPGALSLVNKLSLEESIALISQADLFIGIDSGLLHIAGALRVTALGLWGPTSPHLRFSNTSTQTPIIGMVECRGCQHRPPRAHWVTGCPYDIKCMKSIQVEEVLEAALQRLPGL